MRRGAIFAGVLVLLAFLAGCRIEGPPQQPVEKPAEELGVERPVEEVVFVEEPDFAKVIDLLQARQMHLYASGTNDPEVERKIQASPGLQYTTSYGTYFELTFNPVGPTFPGTGKLNPFHVPAIREAMNWLVDRNYIAQEIFGGLAVPRFLPLTSAFPDYARLADVARALELQYAHNANKAREVITQEMKKLGAELVEGRWHYRGEPVEIIFIIRVEDRRREIGDYVATLLEDLGFVVNRQYKTAAEASPIWIGSDPAEGRWHLYTGGWITTAISRDQAGNFNFFYTPRGRPELLWQAYSPAKEFDEVADRLARRDYSNQEERQELMARALRMALKDSVRIWLVDTISVWPRRADVTLAADLAGGVSGSHLWPFTLRARDRRVIFGTPSILTEPWNPVAGSNWIYDLMIMQATTEPPLMPDPFTGLYWPQRVQAVEVYVQEGVPVTKSHNWLELYFVPEIQVPPDAWLDWDPVAQRFLTVGELHPQGLTAKTRTVIHYDDRLFQMKWHDGSSLTLADLVLGLILGFDRAKKESPIFDEAEVPAFETFMRHFRGLRILQEDPLVVEVYSDLFFPDAEWIAASRAGYLFSSRPWHMLAIGILAEKNKELAFSSAKADKLKVEWTNYIAGPSLEVLERYRQQALKESFIPYAPTMAQYITPEEAARRYRLLGQWYRERGHFWVGQGPFYLESVHTVEKNVVLRRFADFPDPPDKWLRFTEPPIAQVQVSGPRRIETGTGAEFQVEITFGGRPYAIADMDFVKFLVLDARGEIATTGEAQAVRDGLWRVVLTPEQTARLAEGSNRLEVIAVSRLVSIPSSAASTFVTFRPSS